MSSALLTLKTHLGRSRILFFLLLASLYLPWALNSLFIGLFVIHSFFTAGFTSNFKKPVLIPFFLITAFFLISAMSLFYTQHMDDGLIKIQTRLSFLLMPLAIIGSGIHKSPQFRIKVLNAFIILTVFAAIAALANALGRSIEMGSIYKVVNDDGTLVKQSYFTYAHLSYFIMHPAYFSLYTGSAIFIAIYLWLTNNSFFKARWIQLLVILFLSLFLFLLQGRMSILAFILILIPGSLIYLLSKGEYLKGGLLVAIPIIGIIMVSIFPNSITRRFTEFTSLDYNLQAKSVYDFNGITIRLAEWECALHAIGEQPVFGHGLGDAYPALQESYREKNFVIGLRDKYNCHNQYLETMLQTGLIGLLVFLSFFVWILITAVKKKDILLLVLTLFFMVAMLTESLLERQWAIAFFCSILLFLSFSIPDNATESKPGDK